MTPALLEDLPLLLIALAGFPIAALVVRRNWIAALLVAAGSLLGLFGWLLGVLFVPVVLGAALSGAVAPASAGRLENLYLGYENLVGAVSLAANVTGALVALGGRLRLAPRRPLSGAAGQGFRLGVLGTSMTSAVAAVLLVVLLATQSGHLASAVLGGSLHPRATPTPARSLDPGTYSAGRLHAPQSLGGQPLEPPSSRKEVAQARQERDQLSQSAGGAPAIVATYQGFISLQGVQGYLTADQYFAGSQVAYQDVGPVRCGTAGLTICFRSDPAQRLSVAVTQLGAVPSTAQLTNEAWRDLGGH
ncbi:MAG: hypothetical protein WAM30_14690 [Candidatus Dormiibacterota bacterium]